MRLSKVRNAKKLLREFNNNAKIYKIAYRHDCVVILYYENKRFPERQFIAFDSGEIIDRVCQN